MIKKLLIAALFVSNWCAAATFTDVTVTGTPYLTTNVLMEIDESVRVRAKRYSHYRDTLYKDADPEIDYLPLGYKVMREPFTGMILNKNYIYSPVNRYAFVVEVRKWIAGAWSFWIPSIPSGLTNSSDIGYTSKTDFFIDAGLSSNGWRRAFSYDATTNDWRDFSDPMFTSNNSYNASLKSGEIFGPWIIDDLQLALNNMKYTWNVGAFDAFSVDGAYKMKINGAAVGSTWALAKADAESDPFVDTANYDRPYMYSVGTKDLYSTFHAYYYTSEAYTRTRFREIGSALYVYGGTNEIYALTKRPDVGVSTFNANGFAWAEEGVFSLVESVAISAGTTNEIIGIKMASTNFPVWCDEPTIDEVQTAEGFFVVDMVRFTTLNFPYER